MLLEVVASADTLVGPEEGTRGEGEGRRCSGPSVDPAVEGGGGPGKERGRGPQIANYPTTVMLLALEHHTCCFWCEVSPL